MSDDVTTTEETIEQKLARLEGERAVRKAARAAQFSARKIERLELLEKYEQELGPEGSEFSIYDTGHVEDPLVVVKRPLLVQWTKYEQSKQTPTDRFDFVTPSIVHPTRELYTELRNKRIGVEIEASNLLAKLMGLQGESDAGK